MRYIDARPKPMRELCDTFVREADGLDRMAESTGHYDKQERALLKQRAHTLRSCAERVRGELDRQGAVPRG